MQEVEPNLDCLNIQKDIIDFVTDLGYPYVLKATHFKPVGSPHSWPHLLEMLAWLCGFISNIKYEYSHMSQMWTLTMTEEQADQELKHRAVVAKYYKESQEMGGDVDFEELKQKYLREMNTDKVIASLKSEMNRLENKLVVKREENAKFPETETAISSQIEETTTQIAQHKEDKEVTGQMLTAQQEKVASLREFLATKEDEKVTLETEARRQEVEIASLEKVIMAQPPQTEVQKVKQLYKSLTDKVRGVLPASSIFLNW